jgi:hypothetical protein
MASYDIGKLINDLGSADDKVRKSALDTLMALTEERVDWAYEYLDVLKTKFHSSNSFQRNIGAMMIANLAKSDTQGKFAELTDMFVTQMNDEKFITARITLQAAWKFAVASEAYAKVIASGLVDTLRHNRHLSTHGNLIRLDAANSLHEIIRNYPDAVDSEAAQEVIREGCDAKEAMKLLPLLKIG